MATDFSNGFVFGLLIKANWRPMTPNEYMAYLGATPGAEIAYARSQGSQEDDITLIRCHHDVVPGATCYEVYVSSDEPGEQNCFQITVDVL